MKKLLAVVFAVLCLAALVACGENEQTPPEPTEDAQQNVESTDVTIETPYCNLVVSGDFAENVKNEVSSKDPYTVSFRVKSDGTELFSILFGGKTENLLGTLVSEKENVVIYASFAEFDKENKNYEAYGMYQEEINTIIEHLISDNDFVVNEIIPWEDTSTFDIKTSVVTMKYPNKWKDKVTVDVADDSVKFSCGGVKLFDLSFVDCDGYLLGTYMDTPIYMVEHTINKSDYSEEQYIELCTMQEDVNVILQALMEDSNFTISN